MQQMASRYLENQRQSAIGTLRSSTYWGGFQGMEGLAGDCEGQESSLMEREIRGPNMMELGVQEEMDTNCTTVNAGFATSASKP
jgi:hypothetical protein